jgi:hypothetical protein
MRWSTSLELIPAEILSEKDGDERSKHSFSRNFMQKMPNLDGVRKRRFLSDTLTTASSLADPLFSEQLVQKFPAAKRPNVAFQDEEQICEHFVQKVCTSVATRVTNFRSCISFTFGVLTSELIEHQGDQISTPPFFSLDPVPYLSDKLAHGHGAPKAGVRRLSYE